MCVPACVSVCLSACQESLSNQGRDGRDTDRQTSFRQTDWVSRGKESGAERERRGWSYSWRGVVTQLSLTGGCHGERAVPNSGTSNRRRRCLCHHGDGAVPREVVMG